MIASYEGNLCGKIAILGFYANISAWIVSN